MKKILNVFFVICFLFYGLFSEEKHELIGKKVVIIETTTYSMVEGILKEFEPNKFFTVITESGEETTRYWYENMKILTEPSEIEEVKTKIKNSIKTEKTEKEKLEALLAVALGVLSITPDLCQVASVERLAVAMQSPDWSTRAIAMQTEWQVPLSDDSRHNTAEQSAFVEQFSATLPAAFASEPNGFVRNVIARDMSCGWGLHLAPEARLDFLRRESTDPNPVIRSRIVVRFLDHMRCTTELTPSMLSLLILMLDDEAVQTRVTALEILDEVLSQPVPRGGALDGIFALPPKRRGKLSQAGAGGLARFARDLEDPDPYTRHVVGRLLTSGSFEVDSGLKAAAKVASKEARRLIGAWNAVTAKNTAVAYREFAAKYSQGVLAEEARRRTDDSGYAFLQTVAYVFAHAYTDQNDLLNSCTPNKYRFREAIDAVEGFRKSYPGTVYAALAEDFGYYLAIDSLSGLKRFIASDPDSPFAVAAMLRSPALVLKNAGGTVGVTINVGNMEFKGLLGGTVRPEKIRKKVAADIHKQLSTERIASIELDTPEGAPQATDVRFWVNVNYWEAARSVAPSTRSDFNASAVSLLTGALLTPADVNTKLRVIDASTGLIWFHGEKLDEIAGPWDIVPYLGQRRTDKRSILACFLLTLPHVDLADPKQREEAKATLELMTRPDWLGLR